MVKKSDAECKKKEDKEEEGIGRMGGKKERKKGEQEEKKEENKRRQGKQEGRKGREDGREGKRWREKCLHSLSMIKTFKSWGMYQTSCI